VEPGLVAHPRDPLLEPQRATVLDVLRVARLERGGLAPDADHDPCIRADVVETARGPPGPVPVGEVLARQDHAPAAPGRFLEELGQRSRRPVVIEDAALLLGPHQVLQDPVQPREVGRAAAEVPPAVEAREEVRLQSRGAGLPDPDVEHVGDAGAHLVSSRRSSFA
jgi:hypothetical protein